MGQLELAVFRHLWNDQVQKQIPWDISLQE